MKYLLALVAGAVFAGGAVWFGLSSSEAAQPLPVAVPGAACGVEGQIGALGDRAYQCLEGIWLPWLGGATPSGNVGAHTDERTTHG